MAIPFFDYEIPVLKSLKQLGGSAQVKDVYPLVEDQMKSRFINHPEELSVYKNAELVWKNKTRWAREYLKHKEQLDGSVKGVWKILPAGEKRLEEYDLTGKDPDDGKAPFEGVDSVVAETENDPEEAFVQLSRPHETGETINFRGIVFAPTNEQGVITLFIAMLVDLGFELLGVRSKFPDALLRRKNHKGTFSQCLGEFEFRSSNYLAHKHPLTGCDVIICWEHDWEGCPIEVIELKKEIVRLQ